MAEKRTIELEVQDNSKSLKAQYRDAVKELQNIAAAYGETSDQAIKAAKAAADLKDQIEFSKDLVGAFNPDAKFDALTKSFGGVLDGFQAVEGGLALIGVEGEAVQETMLKVQSAMALSQGLQGLMSAKDSFKQLGAVAKTALSGIRSGIAATGIGLFVVALGTVVAYWDDIKTAVNGVGAEQEKLNKGLEKQADTSKQVYETSQLQENSLRLQGKTEKEILQIRINKLNTSIADEEARIKGLEQTSKLEIAAAERNQKIAKDIINLALEGGLFTLRVISLPLDAVLETANQVADALGLGRITAKSLNGYITEGKNMLADFASKKLFDVAGTKAESEATIKEAKNGLAKMKSDRDGFLLDLKNSNQQAAKDSVNTEKTTNKEKLDLTRELIDKQIELIENPYEKERELLKEKAKREKEDLAKSIEGKIYDQEKYNESIKLIDEKLKKDLKQQDLNFMGEGLKAKKAGLDESLLLDKDAADKRLEIALQEQEKKKQLEKEEIERRNALRQKTLELTSDTFSALADLAGAFNTKNEQDAKRQFLIQKAFNLGAAITNTAMAVTGALTAGGNPIKLATGQQFVEAGIAAAVGAANIIKIANSRFGGGAGGGGNTDVPTPAAGGMTAQFNTIGSSGINQLATLQQQPVQAYVVSGEVTSAQSLDRNRVQNATL